MPELLHNWAVVIGINNYRSGISPLQNAVNDAEKLVEILQEKHGYYVWQFFDEQANFQNLNYLLEQTLPQQVTTDDRLLFYFAGHGMALNGEEGPEGYLIPQDAKLGDASSYIPMTQLQSALSDLPCRHFLGILDCCFAGAFRWSSTRDLLTVPEVIHQERYDRFIIDPAWQVIASAAYNQKASDAFNINTDRGQIGNHSPFAAALLEALEGEADIYPPATDNKPAGDGVITATELYLYLRDRIEPATEGYYHRQTPSIWPLKKHDKGEYIFLAPGHPLNLPPAPPLDESQNPYRGLQSFDEQHSSLFFGRQVLTQQLYQQISALPLTVVLGASGTGKSSLVKAGLIPDIKQRNEWHILPPIRPGESPLQVLNNILIKTNLSTSSPNIQAFENNLAAWMQNNYQSILLLVIDQLEELITLCQDQQERENFLQVLAQAANNYPEQLRLVLTLRSDFESQFRNTALEQHWTKARFIVPAMTRAELRQAIEEPASAKVMYFQSSDRNYPLVDRLIDEVADMPGTLPLLSFTLSELYLKYLKRQRIAQHRGETIDRAIAEADYQELGGVMRSLTQRADSEYEELVKQDRAGAATVRHVMLRMVAVGGGDLARRRVPLAELEYPEPENTRVQEVIRRFSAARLLVEGQDPEGKPYVEPAHDTLVRGWQKLLMWQKQAEENLILQRRLTSAAQEWKILKSQAQLSRLQAKMEPVLELLDRSFYLGKNLLNVIRTKFVRWQQQTSDQQGRWQDKPRQFLWNASPYLDLLNAKLISNPNWFNQIEAEFVQQSIKQKQRNIHLRWSIAIAVTTTSVVLTTLALIGQRGALIGQIGELRKTAEVSLRQNQTLDGMIQGLQAGNIFQHPLLVIFPPHFQLKEQVRGTLQEAMYTVRESNRLEASNRPIRSVSFNQKHELLATSGDDGIIRVWNLQNQQVTELSKYQGSIRSVSYSPNGQQLVGAGDDGVIRVWNLQGQLLAEFKGHQGLIRSIRFSQDGRRIASAGNDSVVRLWNLQGQLLAELKGHQGSVRSAIFSPNGQIVASAGEDRTIRLWNLEGKQLGKPFVGHQDNVTSISFSPNSQQLASAAEDETVRLWNLQGQVLAAWKGNQRKIWGIKFSSNGQKLATAGGDGTVRLWNFQGQELERFVGHQGPVRSISFSPGGQKIASASDDLTLRLWDLQGQEFAKSKKHHAAVTSLSLSQYGRFLATAGNDGIYRWTLSGQQLIGWKAAQGSFSSVSLSQDGQLWASGSKDGSIHIWNLQGQQLAELRGHQGAVRSISFSLDDQQLVSAGDDDTIRLWSVQNQLSESGNGRLPNSQKPLLAWNAQQQGVNSISFSRDRKLIVSAGNNSVIRIWNLQGKLLRTFEGHLGSVNSSVFSPNGKQVVSGGNDGTIRVWNLQNGLNERLFQLFGSQVMSVAFSRDGKRIVSGADNGYVQLWDTKTAAQLPLAAWTTEQASVNSVSLSQDDKLLVTAGRDGSVKVWQLESFDQLHQRACDRLHDYFQNHPKSDRYLCND